MNDNEKSETRQQPGQKHRQTAAEKVVDEMKEARAGASDELLEAIMDEEGRPETAEQAQAEKDRADISQELFFFLTDFPEKEGQHMGGVTAVYGVFEGAYASFLLGVEGRALDATEPGENPYFSDTAKEVYGEAIDRASNFLLRYYDAPADALTDKVDACARRYFATYWRDEAAAEQTAAATLPPLRPLVTPKRYGLLNDKTANEFIKGPHSTKEVAGQFSFLWNVDQSGPNEKDPCPVYISMQYNGTDVRLNKPVSAFDNSIFDAVTTEIFIQEETGRPGPWSMTADEIWRLANGIKDQSYKVTDKQRARVTDSIDKMRYTNLSINMSVEIDKHDLSIDDDRIKEGIVDEYLLSASKRSLITETGHVVSGYIFKEMPFLFEYNRAKGNILLFDYDLLDTSDTTGVEGYTIVFRRYLLQQIKLMYTRKRTDTSILFDSMYKALNIPTPAERYNPNNYKDRAGYESQVRQEAKDDRDKIMDILESWTRKNWIRGYTPKTKGRKISGIIIKLNPDNYEKESKKTW